MRPAALDLETFLTPDKGFINFDDPARAAHWSKGTIPHGLSDAVSKMPSGFHAERKHPLNLTGRYAFLAGAHQVDNLMPKMQWKMRRLEDSSLPNSELPFALVAIVKAKAGSLSFHLANALRLRIAAVRANWSSPPKLAFDIRESAIRFLTCNRAVTATDPL
jgi:hypothetical protein